jgi:hypothetical protein
MSVVRVRARPHTRTGVRPTPQHRLLDVLGRGLRAKEARRQVQVRALAGVLVGVLVEVVCTGRSCSIPSLRTSVRVRAWALPHIQQ